MSNEHFLTDRQYATMKFKLTRALKSDDDTKIIKVCEDAFEDFHHLGYPDDWTRWRNAREDAWNRIKHRTTW